MPWSKEKMAAWYAEKRKDPTWYARHKQKSLDQYCKHKEKRAVRSKQYYLENKETRCEKSRNWQRNNPVKVAITKERGVARNYGLTIIELRVMRQATNCEICDSPFSSTKHKHVDHSHTTGQYRGMLCHHCNMGLGRFKDDPQLLRKAAKYLMKHRK